MTVWYTAPTAIRMLMRAGAKLARSFDLSSLRLVASVGEPLNPEAVRWGRQALGRDIHDTWWQTETGAIMIATAADEEVVLGAIGRPLPGIEAAVVRRGAGGTLEFVEAPDQVGELVLKDRLAVDVPRLRRRAGKLRAMFRRRLVSHRRPRLPGCRRALFLRQSRRRGDQVGRPADRAVRSRELPAGAPGRGGSGRDRQARPGDRRDSEGVRGAQGRLSPPTRSYASTSSLSHASGSARRWLRGEIAFCRTLPKTRNGKIVRRLLRARELGLPEGDRSSLDLAQQGD